MTVPLKGFIHEHCSLFYKEADELTQMVGKWVCVSCKEVLCKFKAGNNIYSNLVRFIVPGCFIAGVTAKPKFESEYLKQGVSSKDATPGCFQYPGGYRRSGTYQGRTKA